jgi:hypothetical protein
MVWVDKKLEFPSSLARSSSKLNARD